MSTQSSAASPGQPPNPYEWPRGRSSAAVVSIDFDGPSPYLWTSRASSAEVMGELEQRRFGPRQGVWRILEMLDRLQLPATFYIPGAVVEAHTGAVRAIIAAGHEVALHGYMHERLNELEAGEVASTIERSVDALVAAGASGPFGYRSPSWEMTPRAWEELCESGVTYDSSLMGYDHPYWMDGLVEVPVQWQLDDAIFYRYVNGSTRPPIPASVVMDDWGREISALARFGGLAMMTVHPWLSGRAGRLVAFEETLADARLDTTIWWTTAAAIADYHRDRYPAGTAESARLGAL